MTLFDLVVLAIIGLSTLFAFMRGLIRELAALVSWVVGLIAAVAFTPVVGSWIPNWFDYPVARYLIAFCLILIGALLLGALIAAPLARAVRAAGLGFVDRFLGSIFGLVRGLLVVIALMLLAGLTRLPRTDWWQGSLLAGPLTAFALLAAAYLPREWANALDFPGSGRPARSGDVKA
jgi:membrane protein required for colicin V production